MNSRMYRKGMKDGIPVALGYFVVSITIGIAARGAGLSWLQAAVMSFTNNTSAGQFASFALIASSAPYAEMALSQAVINLRYCLMSCSLSQKLARNMPFFHRFFMAYGVTDEIFGVSVCREGLLSPWYSYGLISAAVPGWTFGTLLGAVSGSILPQRLLSALGVALYGMFLAVILPPARKNKILMGIILVSMGASLLFSLLPVVSGISSGFKIIILTVLIAGGAAFLFPVKEETENE